MRSLQKWGGVAALYEAAAYVVGIVGFLFVVDVSAVTDPIEQVALLADNQLVLSALHPLSCTWSGACSWSFCRWHCTTD